MKPTQKKPPTQLQTLTKPQTTEPNPGQSPHSIEINLEELRSTPSTASSIARITESVWEFYIRNNHQNMNTENRGMQSNPSNSSSQAAQSGLQQFQPQDISMSNMNYVPLQAPQHPVLSQRSSVQPPTGVAWAHPQSQAMIPQFADAIPPQPVNTNIMRQGLIPSHWTIPNQLYQLPMMMPQNQSNTNNNTTLAQMITDYNRTIGYKNTTNRNEQNITRINQIPMEHLRKAMAKITYTREITNKNTDKTGHIISIIKYLSHRIINDCEPEELKEILTEQKRQSEEEEDTDVPMAGVGAGIIQNKTEISVNIPPISTFRTFHSK